MTERPAVQMCRIYDDPGTDDAIRVLAGGRWPRGVSKARAHLEEWCTAVAPSDALGTWYGHSADGFEEFGSRYREELEGPARVSALWHLRVIRSHDRLMLFTATSRCM